MMALMQYALIFYDFQLILARMGQRPPIAAALLPFEIPRSPLAKSLTSKDAADTPGIDTGFQTLLMGTPDKLGETALIEAVILFGESEDDRGEAQVCDILQITLKVLWITHTKVAHPKLHRPCSNVSG